MLTRHRIVTITATAGFLLAVLGAVAVACTLHTGEMWFCDDATANPSGGIAACPQPTVSIWDDPDNVDGSQKFTRSPSNATFFSNARFTERDGKFLLKYINADDVAANQDPYVKATVVVTASTCQASHQHFEDPNNTDPLNPLDLAIVPSNSNGHWDDFEVTMPDAGTYVACAVPLNPGHGDDALNAPGHVAFSIQ